MSQVIGSMTSSKKRRCRACWALISKPEPETAKPHHHAERNERQQAPLLLRGISWSPHACRVSKYSTDNTPATAARPKVTNYSDSCGASISPSASLVLGAWQVEKIRLAEQAQPQAVVDLQRRVRGAGEGGLPTKKIQKAVLTCTSAIMRLNQIRRRPDSPGPASQSRSSEPPMA